MAKERADLDLNIYTDTKDIDNALVRLNKAIKTSDGSVKNLNKGFIKLKAEGKAAGSTIANTFTSMTQRMKAMNLQLRNIQNQFAGSFKALERQAALRGMKTGALSDDKVWYAQIEKLNLQNKQLVDTYSNVANKISLVTVKMNELTGSYARQRAEIARYHNQILHGTEEGAKSLAWDAQLKKDKINAKARNQTALETGKTTTTALNDLDQMESLDRRLGAIQLKLMANYKAINMVTGAFWYLFNYTVEYDKELHQLQAIAAVSDTTMLKLKDSIQAVASSTKFTSLEVAQAGTVLAQAGLSARQIETTLPAIAKLATATGTDLATSTDVVTSTLNIYSLQASEAEHVTNALTTAMNESKADIAGFQKAIQYAGNYAAQLGVTYEETAAVISAATQAGIRSRSMLGTGMRAVLAEFLNPTKKLTAQLEKVGLTVSDIDIKSKGLTNVLKTLKESGFGATEAFRGMERRGAAFLASIINQTEYIDTLRTHMAASTAATEANEIQMGSLSAQLDNFRSIAGTAASDGIAPLNRAMTALLKTINDIISGGAANGGQPSRAGGVIMSALFGAAGTASIVTSIAMVGGAIATMANQIKMLEEAAEAKGIMKLFTFLASWKGTAIIAGIGAVIGAVSYLGEKLGWFTSEVDKSRAAIEKMNGDYEEAKEKGDSVAAMLQRLHDQREKLQSQSERDIFLQEILTRFPEAAQFVNKLTLSFTELEEVLIRLNNLEIGKVAEESAKRAKGMVKENDAIIREYGRKSFKFEDTYNDTNSQGQLVKYSKAAEELFQTMEQSEIFKNFDFRKYRELNRLNAWSFNSGEGQRNQEEIALGITEYLRSYFKNLNDPTAILRQVGTLRNVGAESQDENLKYFIEKVAAEQTQTATSMINANEKLMDDLKTQHASELTALSDNSQEFLNKLAEDQKKVNEELKTSIIKDTDSVKTFVDSYLNELKVLTDKERDMDYLRDEEGNRRSLTSYSYEELARLVGKEPTEENITGIKSEIDKLSKDFHGDTEKAYQAYVDTASGRTQQLNEIATREEAIKQAILALPYGQQRYGEVTGETFRKAVDKGVENLYKARNTKQIDEIAANTKLNARSMLISELANNIRGTNTLPFINALNKEKTLDFGSVSRAYQNAYNKDIETEDRFSSIVKSVNNFNGKLKDFDGAVNNIKNSLNVINPQIPQIQTGMDSFFHRLNTDIKEIDMAYTNATRSMDQMLAKQQGVITGLERAYGSGSAAVKAEQIRLRKLEESQLGDRTAALEAKLFGYTKQLDILRGNPEYQKAKASYDEAFAKWNNAYTTGADQKTVLLAYKNLQDVSKGWDKLATKEESLTSKIADLEDEIQKNTTAINKETEAKKYDREHPLGSFYSGIGDAATSYADQVDQEGLTSFRGMGGYLAEGSINGMNNAFVELFDNITKGSKSASESFKQFGRSIIQTMADVAKEMLAKQVVAAIFSYFMPDFSSGSSGPINITPAGYGKSAAQGGLVTGPIKNRDSVPTMLMPGEYVLKKSAVDSLGRDYLDSLNNKSSTYMTNYSSGVTEANSETTKSGTKSGNGVVNVYVVGQEQQKQMTPQDVVVTITQDMMTGGQTKKLVKSIAMGAI